MKVHFKDKVVVVTGASRGIGRDIALAFAREGARLVLAARSADQLAEVQNDIRALGANALSVPTDVTSTAAVNALVNATLSHFGRIDVLVNNAGIGKVGSVEAPDFADNVRQTLKASLFGMIDVTQRVLPILRQQRSGTIVNMSSVMGRKAFPRFGSYAIVMHAVSAFSDALRQELAGSNIHVSVIHPALTATDFLIDVDESELPPPFRHMTPVSSEEVARATVAAVRRGTRRVVLPRPANALLLGEALSPRIGDLIAYGLTRRPIARLVGVSRGATYHQTLLSRHGSSQREVAPTTTPASVEKPRPSVNSSH